MTENNSSIKYIGCFLPVDELHALAARFSATRLERVIMHPHITYEYMPGQIDRSLFGEEVTVRIVGYGNDGVNEGLLVELFHSCSALDEMAKKIEVPHVTLSVSKDGESLDTRYLSFERVEPVCIKGVFGGYTFGKELITE